MIIALALASAALFGAGVPLQQQPAPQVPMEFAGRPGLLVRLARQPAWLVGVVAEIAGVSLQVVALRRGSLVVVQPLLTTSLLFTVALAGAWTRQEVKPSEWAAVIAVVGGLAVFLAVANPSERSSGSADPVDWVLTGLSFGTVLALLVWHGLRSTGRQRATALGVAAGLSDAFM